MNTGANGHGVPVLCPQSTDAHELSAETVDETPGRSDDERPTPGRPICKCGATEPLVSDPARCRAGHPLVGYVGPAFSTGMSPSTLDRRTREGLGRDFSARCEAFETSVLTNPAAAIYRGYVSRLAEINGACELLADDMRKHGLYTPRGRVRGTYPRYLDSLDRWDKFAQRVGEKKGGGAPDHESPDAALAEIARCTARAPAGVTNEDGRGAEPVPDDAQL